MGNSTIPHSFNLLRWFSIASLLALIPVAAATAFLLSHFITQDTLQRDAAQTAQFIQNCIEIEGRHAGLGENLTFSQFLDQRVDAGSLGLNPAAVESGRQDVLDHLRSLPDVLLASLFDRKGTVIWSTNPELVGHVSKDDDDELEESFNSPVPVARHHASNHGERGEQQFMTEPKEFFIENYIPLHDAKGEVVLVAEVYKEPKYLIAAIKKGQMMVWGTTLLSGALVYLGLFSIVRRGSTLLQVQQRQLVETDALVFVGEMSTAVAHSLRNPLASIRSSAELALSTEDAPVRRNAGDIISQVDSLSAWVRELLLFTRPVDGAPEPVDLVEVLDKVLASFAVPFAKQGIEVEWAREAAGRPRVEGNTALLGQVLHSVLANAIEAMPQGGRVRIALRQAARGRVELDIGDSGAGMSEQQLALAFKPFNTSKRNGLGVGLAMVKRGVERFGGAVTLSSSVGVGTEVRLEFRMA